MNSDSLKVILCKLLCIMSDFIFCRDEWEPDDLPKHQHAAILLKLQPNYGVLKFVPPWVWMAKGVSIVPSFWFCFVKFYYYATKLRCWLPMLVVSPNQTTKRLFLFRKHGKWVINMFRNRLKWFIIRLKGNTNTGTNIMVGDLHTNWKYGGFLEAIWFSHLAADFHCISSKECLLCLDAHNYPLRPKIDLPGMLSLFEASLSRPEIIWEPPTAIANHTQRLHTFSTMTKEVPEPHSTNSISMGDGCHSRPWMAVGYSQCRYVLKNKNKWYKKKL